MICDEMVVSRLWFVLVMMEQLILLTWLGFMWGYYWGKMDKKKALKEEKKTKRKVRKNADNTHNKEN